MKGCLFHSRRFFINSQVSSSSSSPSRTVLKGKAALGPPEPGEAQNPGPQLISQLLGDAKKHNILFSFTYKHKTGRVKADKNPKVFLEMVSQR
ncbi:hypothetical protein SAMN06265337_4173 [Hymenobacter gelipurpurascens]|uniref:Uncharacterized protein n=1 Tax=Hymenobacter gelipurpurascens TaxID=89968 RepID=A0A212UHE1_9BACT|nr:hypothetical protein SAMN06265337_4173 [Hymenobacter gelipurpurascens]